MEVKFNPQQLRIARLMRGYSMAALAELSSISRQSISKYEMGASVPRGLSLLKLAKALDFPVSFFAKQEKTIPMGTVFFRSQAASTNKLRDMQKMRLLFVGSAVDYVSKYIDLPKLHIPVPLEKPINQITSEDIENMADEARRVWDLGDGPILDVTNVLEANGFIVAETTMRSKRLDAVSAWINGRPIIALTDNDESAARRRFNDAHEVGHALLHGSVEDIFELDNTKYNKLLEAQANEFASAFLLPRESFSNYLVSTSMDFFIQAKSYWNVSISALIYRANELQLLSENQYLYLQKKISKNHWRKIEPGDSTTPKECPEIFKTALKMLIDANILSPEQLLSDFSLPKEEVETLFGTELDGGKVIPISSKLHVLKPGEH